MRMDKQINYSNLYSLIHNSKMKVKRVGKKDANTRKHADVLSKRKPKNSAKNLSVVLKAVNQSTKQSVGIHE